MRSFGGRCAADISVALLGIALTSASSIATPQIAAAGGIACPPSHVAFNRGVGTDTKCYQRETASLRHNAGFDAILPLGDLIEPDPPLRCLCLDMGPAEEAHSSRDRQP